MGYDERETYRREETANIQNPAHGTSPAMKTANDSVTGAFYSYILSYIYLL